MGSEPRPIRLSPTDSVHRMNESYLGLFTCVLKKNNLNRPPCWHTLETTEKLPPSGKILHPIKNVFVIHVWVAPHSLQTIHDSGAPVQGTFLQFESICLTKSLESFCIFRSKLYLHSILCGEVFSNFFFMWKSFIQREKIYISIKKVAV